MKRALHSKVAFRLALVSLFFFALVPMIARSSWFLRPVSISHNDDSFVFVRETPYGAVTARWHAEIYVPATGQECSIPVDVAYLEDQFQPRPFDTVRFPVHPLLRPCADATGVKVFTAEWTVVLWGWFPMVPMGRTFTFGGE